MSFKRYPAKVLQPLKEYLQAQAEELSHQLAELESGDPYNEPGRTSDNEAGDDSYENNEHDKVVALKEQIAKSLEEIKRTLKRIDDGSYGFCSRCGKMINTDRLAIRPTAELCIDCERELEKKKQ